MEPSPDAMVAGLVCLDFFPGMDHLSPGRFMDQFGPGQLVVVGPALFATGGAVANTGLALHRLGISVRLAGLVGSDPFGQVVRDQIEAAAPGLSEGIGILPGMPTSYTVILNPPGVDRIFLHCPGANHQFGPEHVDFAALTRMRLFHFGYPPIMRRMFTNCGAELAEIFRRAKDTGVTTSLDLCQPDPNSPAGRTDWTAILAAALPYVDLFVPSIEELLFTLRPELYRRFKEKAWDPAVQPGLISELGGQVLELGAKVLFLKLGEQGAYVRTAGIERLRQMGRAVPANLSNWAGRELWAPGFLVNLSGATGAGDCAIAGFLAALLRSMSLEAALVTAAAVGACNVEAPDALSGVRSWEDTQARIAAGWERRPLTLNGNGWSWNPVQKLWERETK